MRQPALHIGAYTLEPALILAPMAGLTDLPFRRLCREFGASLAVAEMISADAQLWETEKSRLRRVYAGEPRPHCAQLLGADPQQMALAAQRLVDDGVDIIDINMGCPVRKVQKRAAGAALLGDEAHIARLLQAVVNAVTVPVTLKIRLGLDPLRINAVAVARLAQACGIAALSVHGRTLQCGYHGAVNHAAIGEVKAAVSIPVIANGDIRSTHDAQAMLQHTGAAGLMVGRGAHSRPWFFAQLAHFLRTGIHMPPPDRAQIAHTVQRHLAAIHQFYGPEKGVLQARAHLKGYVQQLQASPRWQQALLAATHPDQQHEILEALLRGAKWS